ncbi:MAG: cyclase family protein [Bdellovibrionota bacterium]
MILEIHNAPGTIQFDSTQGIDLSIPISFNTPVRAFNTGAPSRKSYEVDSYIGSVERGGSSNCDVVEFIPHCHGTHTECIGHITHKKTNVRDALEENIFLAKLVTIDCTLNMEITSSAIAQVGDLSGATALIIRTLPNDISKKTKSYSDAAPYFSAEAIDWISRKEVSHLLFDSPSIDPMWDEGKMLAHRRFWNVEPGQTQPSIASHMHKTVTELLFIPSHVKDGFYVLDLQVSNFELDAAPSRPMIYPIASWRSS